MRPVRGDLRSHCFVNGVSVVSGDGNVLSESLQVAQGAGSVENFGALNVINIISFDSSRAVPTGPENSGRTSSVNYWRRVPI